MLFKCFHPFLYRSKNSSSNLPLLFLWQPCYLEVSCDGLPWSSRSLVRYPSSHDSNFTCDKHLFIFSLGFPQHSSTVTSIMLLSTHSISYMANISIIYISLPSRTLINIYNGVLKCLQSVFLGSHVYEPTVCNADQHRGWCTQFWIDEVSYTWIRTMGSYESSTQLFGGLFGNSFWAGSPCYFNIARSLFFFLRSVLSWWLLCTCTDLWSYSHIKLTCSGQLLAHELCYWFPILDWIRMLHPWCLLWFCQFGTSDNRDWFRLLDWIWML
jgi:hypothetical protein